MAVETLRKYLCSLDYLDDAVRNRWINVLILSSLFSPLMKWLLDIYEHLNAPTVAFILYFVLSFITCIFTLIPMGIGNNAHSSKIHICCSIIACLIVSAYTAYSSTQPVPAVIPHIPYIYVGSNIVCSIFAFTAAMIYFYLLICQKNHVHTLPHHIQFSESSYSEMSDIASSDDHATENRKCIDMSTMDREIDKGFFHLIKQFLWPTYDGKSERLKYPSRLYAAIFLGLVGIAALFELSIHFQEQIRFDYLKNVREKKQNLQTTMNLLPSKVSKNLIDTQQALIDTMELFESWLISLQFGVTVGAIIGLIAGIYGSFIVFRAFKKKVLEIRAKRPTFNYKKSEYPIKWTARFVSILSSYLICLSFVYMFLFGLMLTILANENSWIWCLEYWQYLLGYAVYYFCEYVLVRWLLMGKYLLDKDGSLRKERSDLFRFWMLVIDMAYLPLALTVGLWRMIFWFYFGILSYLRPDVNVYPRGCESYDSGHLVFVATVRLFIEREAHFHVLQSQTDLQI